MPTSDGQADIPRFPRQNLPITRAEVMALLNDIEQEISGISGGSGPAATGANYRFNGSGAATELQLLNATTGLYNDISSTGADGAQSVVLGNGEA